MSTDPVTSKLDKFRAAQQAVRLCFMREDLTMHESNTLLGCFSRLQDLISCIEHAQKEKTT